MQFVCSCPCFVKHLRPLVPAAFAVVSTYQPALGSRGGLWPVVKAGASALGLMMMMMSGSFTECKLTALIDT
jgi:hypothetical protein